MVTVEQVSLNEVIDRAFDRKRANFLDDHDLRDKPVLVWQAWPVNELLFDVSSEKLQEAMRGGGGAASDDGWWYGFKMSWRPALMFDGLTSSADREGAGWATEVHVDGHISAGLWSFPEVAQGGTTPVLGVVDFYVDAFRDFAYLAGKVMEAAGASGAVHLTATMYHADRLALLAGRGHIAAPAPKRKTLRWPIAIVDAADLLEASSSMAAQFMRIYGRSLPKS